MCVNDKSAVPPAVTRYHHVVICFIYSTFKILLAGRVACLLIAPSSYGQNLPSHQNKIPSLLCSEAAPERNPYSLERNL